MFRRISIAVASLVILISAAAAQNGPADVTVSGTGLFTKDASGNTIVQKATSAGGFLGSFRYGFSRHSALELNYGYSRNSQYYGDPLFGTFAGQQANVHEFTGAYVLNFNRDQRLDPFVLAGGGALLFSPVNNSNNFVFGSDSQVKGTFLYGAGVNYRLFGGVGLRLQYRGLVYKAPDFGLGVLSTGSWTHTAEPSVGLMFRF